MTATVLMWLRLRECRILIRFFKTYYRVMNANIIYHNLAKERGMGSAYRRLLCVILSMLLLGIVIESNLSAKEILVLSARDSLR